MGGEGVGLSVQSTRSATITLSSSDTNLKRRSQFLSSIASAPRSSAAPESLDATHVTSSYKKSRSTISDTSSYSSKAAHVGFYTGGTRMSGCFSRRKSATGHPVFCADDPREKTPPPPPPLICRWPNGTPVADFSTSQFCGRCAPGDNLPLLHVSRCGFLELCPLPTHPPLGLHVCPSLRGTVSG